jgi:hypothetical protein
MLRLFIMLSLPGGQVDCPWSFAPAHSGDARTEVRAQLVPTKWRIKAPT